MDLERERNERWSGGLRRWRWPINGKEIAGDGGRLIFRLDLVSKILVEIKRKREERIKSCATFIFSFFFEVFL